MASSRTPDPARNVPVPDRLSARFDEEAVPLLGQLRATAIAMTGNPADADDLLQETCLWAWVAFGTFTEGTNLKAWLNRILINIFINDHRKRAREPRRLSVEETTDAHWSRRHLGAAPAAGHQCGDGALQPSLRPDQVADEPVADGPDQQRTADGFGDQHDGQFAVGRASGDLLHGDDGPAGDAACDEQCRTGLLSL
ncbi:sigma factor [Streptomyces sp. NBC_00576]|uniref:sigma factor n=1 Tax=Streptomyces sp. NBC_00576 TaxID=2903665 RepID=UPI002E806A67|nr:sigma factor [Streptomyces sp. NBC_00576]WUB75514.1 RNA polymerase sigma factor [Streptomyces sp. NBC_00576]